MNGAWLPSSEDRMKLWSLPNGVAHPWLNHSGYHSWLAEEVFTPAIVENDVNWKRQNIEPRLRNACELLMYGADKIPSHALRKKVDTANRGT